MSRWLIKADISDPNKLSNDSNVPLQDTDDIGIDQLEKNENVWKETFNESREADTVFGVEEDEYKPFKTISDGHK